MRSTQEAEEEVRDEGLCLQKHSLLKTHGGGSKISQNSKIVRKQFLKGLGRDLIEQKSLFLYLGSGRPDRCWGKVWLMKPFHEDLGFNQLSLSSKAVTPECGNCFAWLPSLKKW